METSERHQEDEAHSAGIYEEHEEVASSRQVNDSSRYEGEQGSSDLEIISFRRYLEEFYVEEENTFKEVNQDEDEQGETEEKSS